MKATQTAFRLWQLIPRRTFLLGLPAAVAGLGGFLGAIFRLKQHGLLTSAQIKSLGNRLIETEAEKISDEFWRASGDGIFTYYQHFFPRFLVQDPMTGLEAIARSCAQKLKEPNVQKPHRYQALPSVAAIHTIPYVHEPAERRYLADVVFQQINRAADPESGKANREAIEIPLQTLVAVLQNPATWTTIRVGTDLLNLVERVCKSFLDGESALLFAALIAWQFLLTYERVLHKQNDSLALEERRQITRIRSSLEDSKSRGYWWLGIFAELFGVCADKGNMPPQYSEVLLLRSKFPANSPERDIGDLSALVRMHMAWVSRGIGSSNLTSPFSTVERSRQAEEICISLSRSAGFDRELFEKVTSKWGKFLDKEEIDYFHHILKTPEPVPEPSPLLSLLPLVFSVPEVSTNSVYKHNDELFRDLRECAADQEQFLTIVDRTARRCAHDATHGLPTSFSEDELRRDVLSHISENRALKSWGDAISRAAEESKRKQTDQRKTTLPAAPTRAGNSVDIAPPGGTGEKKMNTSENSEPIREYAPGQSEAHHVSSPIDTGAALGIFASSPKVKVRFHTREAAIDGFGVLAGSGYPIRAFGNYTYGLVADKQVALLTERNIPFEQVS